MSIATHLIAVVNKNYLLEAKFYISALAMTGLVLGVGSMIFLNTEGANDRAAFYSSDDYVLTYADGGKALFKTKDGVELVTLGSSTSFSGRVVSIRQINSRWTVTTSKNQVFVQR